MATFNEGKSRSQELPTEQDLVAYDHVAAGHEGISSIDDGSVIIKPCTEAEINFYQAAQAHEGLKAHMPIFMGVLTLGTQQMVPPSDIAPAAQIHHENPTKVALDVLQNLPPDPAAESRPSPSKLKRASWKPSGGKKLDTPHAIVLENVASGFNQPNILDIKLGARLWADDAPQAKRVKLDDVAAKTTSGKLGYRIAGMKRYIGPGKNTAKDILQSQEKGIKMKDSYLCYDKEYGRTFNSSNVKDAFIEYFGGVYQDENGETKFARSNMTYLLRRIFTRLEELKDALAHEESRMYSSSILLVTEGDLSQEASQAALEGDRTRQAIAAKADVEGAKNQDGLNQSFPESSDGSDKYFEEASDSDGSDETEGLPKLFDLRLIDFAHANFVPGDGSDQNMLHGINNVLSMFETLLKMAGEEPGQ